MNPFPIPTDVSVEIDNQIREIIKKEFKLNNKLEFHTILKFIEDAVAEKDLKKSTICAYYATNITKNTSHLSDKQKEQIINGLYETINDLEYDLKNI